MKKSPCILLSALLFSAGSLAAYQPCEKKINIINDKIRIAEKYGNQQKVDGLKRALEETEAYCLKGHPDYQNAVEEKTLELQEELQAKKYKIKEVKNELEQSLADLNEDVRKARQDGKQDKIEKYQRKSAEKQREAQEDIAELKNEISQLQQQLREINR